MVYWIPLFFPKSNNPLIHSTVGLGSGREYWSSYLRQPSLQQARLSEGPALHGQQWEAARQRLSICSHISLHTPPASTHIMSRSRGASLVAQWLRICLPMQGKRVRALVWEDPTCRGATKPMCHNYWACALEPAGHNYWACAPQLLKLTRLEPVLRNKISHCNEKPTHRKEE